MENLQYREQELYHCTIMRGGTSKAIYLKRNELPEDPVLRDKIILGIFGSPDLRQIDGLGGSDITTSKVAIIGPATREDADVDYTFGQVQLTTAEIAWNTNCGNISSAVGPYAIDEGMVKVSEPYTTVRIHNTNTGKILNAIVEVRGGRAAVSGNYVLDGVPGSGAKIALDYSQTFGSATGKLLPTGNAQDILDVPGLGKIPVSIVDIANSACFVKAESLGITGTEARPDIMANPELMKKLEAIRSAAALACGFVKPGENATEVSPLRPMIAFVAPPTDYVDYVNGEMIHAGEADFIARVLWNQMPTETFTGTGSICITVASRIPGTVVSEVCHHHDPVTVRFGHARGINEVDVRIQKTQEGFVVERAVFNRTARRIMDGYVYVNRERLL